MEPNPVKLEEELLQGHRIPDGAVVCGLGSGQGMTSSFLTKEYGFTVYAADLWNDARIIPSRPTRSACPSTKPSLTRWSASIRITTLAATSGTWTTGCCHSSSWAD